MEMVRTRTSFDIGSHSGSAQLPSGTMSMVNGYGKLDDASALPNGHDDLHDTNSLINENRTTSDALPLPSGTSAQQQTPSPLKLHLNEGRDYPSILIVDDNPINLRVSFRSGFLSSTPEVSWKLLSSRAVLLD